MKRYIISLVASLFLIIISSSAHTMFYAYMPKEGINYHLSGNGGKITYFGEQCPLNQPSCEIECRPYTNLVPGCFNLSKVMDDTKHLKLMGVKHVRLMGPHIYVFMNWSREKGYISFDHPHYGSQIIDNFRQVIDLFHQNGINLTIGLMGNPPNTGVPKVSESHFFYQFFQCFENTKDKVRHTLIPKYPDKHNNLKKAPADFIDMFKDHPAIVTWTTFGEINVIFNHYAGTHDNNSGPIKIACNYFKNYFLDMRQRVQNLQWPGGTRTQMECQLNEDCPGMEYCKKMDGDCEGIEICAPIPEDCPDYWAPVCGCDGLTYSSDCEAAFAGVNIEHHGRCEDSISIVIPVWRFPVHVFSFFDWSKILIKLDKQFIIYYLLCKKYKITHVIFNFID